MSGALTIGPWWVAQFDGICAVCAEQTIHAGKTLISRVWPHETQGASRGLITGGYAGECCRDVVDEVRPAPVRLGVWLLIGSGERCDLRIDDPSVAPAHAKVRPYPERVGWGLLVAIASAVGIGTPGRLAYTYAMPRVPVQISPGCSLKLGNVVVPWYTERAPTTGRTLGVRANELVRRVPPELS